MSPAAPSRRLDSCSFNGLLRRELVWRGAHLHGTDPFICSYCLQLGEVVFAEDVDRTIRPPDLHLCSFCGAGGYLAAGPAHLICESCVARFLADERPSWGALLFLLESVNDAACILSLAAEYWETLVAGAVPISDCEADVAGLAVALSRGGAVSLVTHAAGGPSWEVGDLLHTLSSSPPSRSDWHRVLARFASAGLVIGHGPT